MKLTWKYKLRPNAGDRERLFAILKEDRTLYNAALEERINQYGYWKRTGIGRKGPTFADQCRALTEIRRDDPEIAKGHRFRQTGPLKVLDEAFSHFFRRVKNGEKPGFPKFKAAKFWRTIRIDAQCRIRSNRIYTADFPNGIRFFKHRDLPDTWKSGAKITLKADGWWLTLPVEVETPEQIAIEDAQSVIGIDVGISHLATTSDGDQIENPKMERKNARRIRRLQRELQRAKRVSKSRERKKRNLAKAKLAEANRRKDHLHKVSRDLCDRHDLIVYEELNTKGLAKSKLARDVHDASWSTLLGMIDYKASKGGGHAVGVDPRGTSQECSGCGEIVRKSLSQRTHRCTSCGLVLDRDVNAAINIRRRGLGISLSSATPIPPAGAGGVDANPYVHGVA